MGDVLVIKNENLFRLHYFSNFQLLIKMAFKQYVFCCLDYAILIRNILYFRDFFTFVPDRVGFILGAH